MNYLKITFIAISLLLMSVTTVLAVDRGLLLLGTSRQSIDVSYNFTNASFGKTSSREQLMIENYGFGIDYAVLNPDILSGTFNINLLANQDELSGNASGKRSASTLGFLYDFKADFFSRSASSLNAVYKSQINDVQSTFGGSYKLTTDSFGANWVIRNNVLPVAFSYSHSISSTDGTPDDGTYTNNEVGIHASHTMGISRTNLDLTDTIDHFESKSSTNNSEYRQYKGSFRNYLVWNSAGLERSLDSSVNIYESAKLNANLISTIDWQENLMWDLGKALKSNLSYSYNNSSTDRGKQQSNAVAGQLQHILFKSLTTQLQTNARYYDDNNLSESEINGRVSLSYRKMLPANSTLDMGYYLQYGVTERTQSQGVLLRRTVLKEPHSVVFGKRIVLVNPNYLPGSILVYNAATTLRPSIFTYIEGVDFRVEMTGPLAEVIVIPGSQMDIETGTPGNNNLLITYDYQLDNNQRYATTNQGVNGSVSLMDGKYRIFAGIDQSNQVALAGGAQSSLLNSYTRINAGLNAKLNKYSLSSEIIKYDSTFEHSRTLDSSLDYANTLRGGVLALYLKDSYRWYGFDPVMTQGPESIVSMGGNYSIPSVFYGSMTLRADYSKWISNVDSDRLAIGADLRWTLRKFMVSLQSNFAYRRTSGEVSESESIRLHVTRFF